MRNLHGFRVVSQVCGVQVNRLCDVHMISCGEVSKATVDICKICINIAKMCNKLQSGPLIYVCQWPICIHRASSKQNDCIRNVQFGNFI